MTNYGPSPAIFHHSISHAADQRRNLVRFAHPPEAENNGIMELWNDGFKENKTQGAYDCIDFLVLMEYFMGQKEENRWLVSINIKCRFNILCRIGRFPLLIPNIPTFRYSIIPYGLSSRWPQKIL